MTISNDNPIDIDEYLENRFFRNTDAEESKSSTMNSSIFRSRNDSNHSTLTAKSVLSASRESLHSNVSGLTNRSSRSRASISTLTNQNSRSNISYDSNFSATSSPKRSSVRSNRSNQPRAPVQILINDGEGSIDTMSFDGSYRLDSSPRSKSNKMTGSRVGGFVHQTMSRMKHKRRQRAYDTDESGEDGDDDYYDEGDVTKSYDFNTSVSRDNTDVFVSPLDTVLDEEDSYSDLVSIHV